MDASELRHKGNEMINFVANYWETIRSRPPLAQVTPGYLEPLLPNEAPSKAEKWEDILDDVERVIMPGVASPACTELEMKMMKWLGKLIDLPADFHSSPEGGGVIQGTASEATLVSLLAARSKSIKNHNIKFENINSTKMIVYCSDQSHSSVERAAMLLLMQCRRVVSDNRQKMNVSILSETVMKDISEGFLPVMCVATLGTTSTCSFDDLLKIGKICKEHDIWLHVDAAYAGSAFVCPEYRRFMKGIEYADSFNFNPHKWLLTNFDCSALWLKNSSYMVETFNVDPVYLQHANQEKVLDYRHWQIPLGRRFRSLKLWFTLRLFGVEGIQTYIRKNIALAKEFENLVSQNSSFEIVNEVILGLVCFRLKGNNSLTKLLLEKINADGEIYLVPSEVNGLFFIRFAICSSLTNQEDVNKAWNIINKLSREVLMNSI